jgi:hypothetical protein
MFGFFGFIVVSVLIVVGIVRIYNIITDLTRTIKMQREELRWYRTAAQRGHVKPYPGNIAE